MVHPCPEERPSALGVLQHRAFSSWEVCDGDSTTQLRRALDAERLRSQVLSKQLQEATKCLKTLAAGRKIVRAKRPVGKGVTRSISATNF